MSKEVVLFKSEERKERQSLAAFLHQLADKIAQGEVALHRGSEQISLRLPGSVVLEIKVEEEAERGKPKRSLEIEIEWVEGEEPGGVTLG
ncbi:MAG: amphi-Trp domain-containing protein [Anaerolineae bacterium]|nr:amphi-Trp domain-containing protein [Anaerolineae bacterium]